MKNRAHAAGRADRQSRRSASLPTTSAQQLAQTGKASRSSRRIRLLLGILVAFLVLFVASWPLRARILRDTARIERETALRNDTSHPADDLMAAETEARRRVSVSPGDPDAHIALSAALGRM